MKAQPNNADFASALSWDPLGLNEKVSALKYARLAVSLLPASKDAMFGPKATRRVLREFRRAWVKRTMPSKPWNIY